MFRMEIHQKIQRIIEVFRRVGFWHRGDAETVGERRLKIFYSTYSTLFLISVIAGAVSNQSQMDEKVPLVLGAMMLIISQVKLLWVIWRQPEILEHLNRICVYCIEDRATFISIKDKVNVFITSITVVFFAGYASAVCVSFVLPFVGTERKLFLSIGFPLDWRNDELGYWMASTFFCTELIITSIALLSNIIFWYLMATCGYRYEVLGQQMLRMGEIRDDESTVEYELSDIESDNFYLRDLVEAINSHNQLKEITNKLASFLSEVFAMQLAVSGLCICVSIYCILFIRSDYLVESLIYLTVLVYNIFDIFMIMYYGNEIKLTSDQLSYHLYASNWIERSQSIKKNVILFGEFLMRPHELIIMKLYPLTLETFTRVLNSAYSMFNILKNFK